MSEPSPARGSNRAITIGIGVALLAVIGVVAYMSSSPSAPEASAPSAQASTPAKDIYQFESPSFKTDFTKSVPPQFSESKTAVAKGERTLLGLFNEQGVNVKLTALPIHQAIHVTFDLALTKSWNGSNSTWGPDTWMCAVVGGPTLLRTTFSNCGFFNDNNEQNYPDVFPTPLRARSHPAWTGASEKQTLGSIQSWGGPDRTFDCSGVYHIDWTFPHDDPTIELAFTSAQRLKHDKLFGLLSFKLEPVESLTALSGDEMNKAWLDLGQSNAVVADAAVWKLISAGDRAATFIASKLGPTPVIPQELRDPYSASRVRHVLEVIHSTTADQLLATLPPDPTKPIPQ